jgi:hypothetical protein
LASLTALAERASFLAGYALGVRDERRDADRRWAAKRPRRVTDEPTLAELEPLRFRVCCRRCRTSGRVPGCTGCQYRTRATFGLPHPDDYPGGPVPLGQGVSV